MLYQEWMSFGRRRVSDKKNISMLVIAVLNNNNTKEVPHVVDEIQNFHNMGFIFYLHYLKKIHYIHTNEIMTGRC